MNKQYIGARYVPKFSDKNGGVWDNSYSYEPLEIVKHGADFYTSKIPVPTGVDITNTTYWVKTGDYNGAISGLQEQINDIKEGLEEFKYYISPLDFGAVGDGTTNDSNAVSDAINALEDGYKLFIPSGYVFECNDNNFNILKDYITITGGGTIKNGTITIGNPNDTASHDYHCTVDNIKIINDSDQDCIRLIIARNVKITNCELVGDYAIRAMGYAVTHGTALINISNNRINSRYGVRAETVGDGWQYTNDWHIENNIFNMTNDIAIWLTGIDGAVIDGNTVFMSNTNDNRQNILIDGVANNQIIITSNNLFEAGYEGISLISCKGGVIQSNSIVWCGQVIASDGIKLDGSQAGLFTIGNNRIEQFTKSGIEILGAGLKSCTINGNTSSYGTNHYRGSEDLTAIDHFGVSINFSINSSNISDNKSNVDDSFNGMESSGDSYDTLCALKHMILDGVSITQATNLCKVSSNRVTNYGGGLIVINAMNSVGSNNTTAVYILGASMFVGNNNITELYKGGYTSGGGTGHPSFTFSINDGKLVATPVGSTSGNFIFNIMTFGDISIGKL